MGFEKVYCRNTLTLVDLLTNLFFCYFVRFLRTVYKRSFVPLSDPSGHNGYFAQSSIVLLAGEEGVVTCLSVCN